MGTICSTNKRIIPKSTKASLGLRSGQTISSASVMHQHMTRTKTSDLVMISKLDIQDEELVEWDDPQKYLHSILKGKGYRVLKVLKTTASSITAEISDVTQSGNFIFKRSLFDNFDKASNNISYLYNLNKVTTQGILTFQSLTITIFDQPHLQIKQDKTLYALDRIIPKYCTVVDSIKEGKLDTLQQSLVVMEQVAESLLELHKAQFAYRFLRPDCVMTKDHKKFLLSNPSIQIHAKEKKIIAYFIQQERDYYQYDCILYGLLFLYLIDPKLYTFDELVQKRIERDEWTEAVANYQKCLGTQFKAEIPQIIKNLIEMLCAFDKHEICKIADIYQNVKSCRQKGIQTFFKNDSLGAYLQYHRDKNLQHVPQWLYFTKANQIHLYNYETQKFHYLKIFRKKQPFRIETDVMYHTLEDKFFFFSGNQSQYLLKIYDEAHEKNMISQRREVELFRHMKSLAFDDPQLILIEKNETDSDLYIMNQQQMTDEETQDVYYQSYVISFTQQLVENIIEDEDDLYNVGQEQYVNKKIVRVLQGPKNYQWHRSAFHFYDPHNHYIYCIPDYNNIFQNGIRFSYFDTSQDKGHFKEGLLRFACSTEDVFRQFCQLNMKIRKVTYCVEVQHGVFLMHASNNIFILDFNFKCFYSLASLTQLQTFEQNNKKDPKLYVNAYETRNQPFELKCQDAGGRNFIFQNGYLHCIARKEIETVHCIFEILPQQACLLMLNCYSLHSNQDLLLQIPKTLEQIVSTNQKIIDENSSRRYIKTVKQYGCFKCLYQEGSQIYLTAENEDHKRFYLHAVQVPTVQDVSQLFQAFTKRITSDILLTPIEQFAQFEDKQFTMYYVNEDIVQTMDSEIENRKLKLRKFKSAELGLLIKILFRALKELKDSQLEHGSLCTPCLCFTKTGIIKISGWYQANRKGFISDVDDALKVVYCLATLNRSSDVAEIDIAHPSLLEYDGLLEFIRTIMKLQANTQFNVILNQALGLARLLTAHDVDFNKFKSKAEALIWIGYGNNHIIVTPVQNMKEPRFIKLSLVKPNNTPFKLSKHCMFTFNNTDTIYISGAVKEDLRSQTFYEISFTTQRQSQIIQIKRLPDIPFSVLSPSLLYCDYRIFSIGGYELGEHQNKNITDKVYSYNIKTKEWRPVSKMPISLYGASALYCPENQNIYLFGGISNEIDLTSDKLIYLTYDIIKDHWEFNVDLSFKSPFLNSRFTKPIIDIVSPTIFLSYQKTEDGYFFIDLFELVRGGVSLKFKVKNPAIVDKVEQDFDGMENLTKDYKRTLQDDLSLVMQKDIIYTMDEDTQNLNIFRLKDVFHPQYDMVPCSIQENVIRLYSQDNL